MVVTIDNEIMKQLVAEKGFTLPNHCDSFADTRTLSREEWLKYRRSGIGGSDASAILGLSHFKTELSLWEDKVSTEDPVEEQSEVAYWGSTIEPVLREEFSKRHSDAEVYILPFMLRSKSNPFMIADLDGLVYMNGEWCGLEIKTSSEYIKDSWGSEGDEKIPLAYQVQVQHYMAVTGLKKFIFVALIGGNHYVERVVEANAEVQSRIIFAEDTFWSKVENHIRPELDGTDYSTTYINSKFTGNDAAVLDLAEEAELLSQYVEAKEALDKAKEAVKDAEMNAKTYENRLKEHMGSHTDAVCGDYKISYRMRKGGSLIDSKSLKADYPDIYDKYSKEKSPSYILSVAFCPETL